MLKKQHVDIDITKEEEEKRKAIAHYSHAIVDAIFAVAPKHGETPCIDLIHVLHAVTNVQAHILSSPPLRMTPTGLDYTIDSIGNMIRTLFPELVETKGWRPFGPSHYRGPKKSPALHIRGGGRFSETKNNPGRGRN
jgi:hypothetical protein